MTALASAHRLILSPRWQRWRGPLAALALLALLLLLRALPWDTIAWPEAWDLHLRRPIDAFRSWVIGNRATHWLWLWLLDPLSAAIDWSIRRIEQTLLAIPWPLLVGGVALLGQGRRSGMAAGGEMVFSLASPLLSGGCLLLMGMLGLWVESLQTLALMVVSVGIALQFGIPLGIWAARNPRLDAFLRPILDAMQTMPAFVYLIPVLLFFGIARVPSVIATVIYALPPAIRFTTLGIRQVPAVTVEAARAFGSTSRQLLFKVQLPLALPTIMAGVNQTIMLALGIVVIAALIGAGGLGREVLVGLQRLRVGQAFEAGLAIVFMAIMLDRLSHALSQVNVVERRRAGDDPSRWAGVQAHFPRILRRHADLILFLLLLVVVYALRDRSPDLRAFPAWLRLPLAAPVDTAVGWARDHLYEIGNTGLGAGPFSDFLILRVLTPLRSLLTLILPWPVVILAIAAIAAAAAGRRLAVGVILGMLAMGWLSMWQHSMDTLSQTFVAVLLAILIALPAGILAAKSDLFDTLLRPVLDFLQTIPSFVYLVPVIMLFNVGRVPGIIASVLYALSPAIRLTNLGIRQVDGEVLEAARAFGSTPAQILFKVELPLAMPSIMMGINQTVMMVLAMVIIAGLVGGGGLGLEVVIGLAKNETGRGVEAGLAIVILAMIFDRITQGWAGRWRTAAGRS